MFFRSRFPKFTQFLYSYSVMDQLKQLFYEKTQILSKEIKELLKEHGDKKIDDVTLDQTYGGMRDITCMIWGNVAARPRRGNSFQGLFHSRNPRKTAQAPNGKEPLPEGLFWPMMVVKFPPKSRSSG